MKIVMRKTYNIDMEKIRRNTNKSGYTKAEKTRLLNFYGMFEAGEFEAAVKYMDTWGGNQGWLS